MTSKGIHTQVQSIPANSTSDTINLLRGAMLKTSLHKKVSEPVDHKLVGMSYDRINDAMLLFRGPNFELLLKKY
jgi:hypothetical protein